MAVTTTTNNQRREYVTRDRILKLLSDEEVARVTTAETAAHLSEGDEYLDLEQLNQGVQWASKSTAPIGSLLPRKAVKENTWSKILTQLVASGCVMAHKGA